MTPVVFVIIALAFPFFDIWLGTEFANNSSLILQILALGFLINSIASVPSSALQAIGRPDITAKLHMIELPIYLGILWWLVQAQGIIGAALAWIIRIIIDSTLLFWFFYRLTPDDYQHKQKFQYHIILWCSFMLFTGWLITIITAIYFQIGLVLLILTIFLYYTWKKFLDKEETGYISELIARLFKRSRS